MESRSNEVSICKEGGTHSLFFLFAKNTCVFMKGVNCMERFKKQKLNKKDHAWMSILAGIVRVILFPIFIVVRIYCWVWDYDYLERFGR